ncbi:conserved hypothetical protein [Tenacibaculum sp. 190524A05c]|uniref:DUF4249 domain-containing protein n=1 Tax=Tenacibaculum platacis TaxID=3137852 RepID=UPI0031FB9829
MKRLIKIASILISFVIIHSCIEAIEFENITFDGNLVVKALITNETKKHTIELSRTIPIDSTKLNPEKNARVFIADDSGMIFDFVEINDGTYESATSFAAQTNKLYTLNIETSDGQTYSSIQETLPKTTSISNLKVGVEENEIEYIREMVIRVDSDLTSDEGKYYRYEYEETYKIKTPLWTNDELKIISDTKPYEVILVQKDPAVAGEGFCYPTEKSNQIFLTETINLGQDQVVGFPIRQIPIDNYRVGLRYSILVKQYVINQNTFDFYTLLDKFSEPDNIFSQTQVGNIPSNISNNKFPTEDRVIGFFEVSSVSEKRLFFNRSDYFGLETPFINYWELIFCVEPIYPLVENALGQSPLIIALREKWSFFPVESEDIPPNSGPYSLLRTECTNCSQFGPVFPPSFWVE